MSDAPVESHRRSVLKGISWRVVGTLDTILISWLVTGHGPTALKIGATEVATKVALFYLHERLWLTVLRGRTQSRRVSIAKAVTWRVVGTADTVVLGWFFSGSASAGLRIGATEVLTKIVLFYLHERAWNAVPVGTVRHWFRRRS